MPGDSVEPEAVPWPDDVAAWAATFLRQVGAHPLPLYGSEDFIRSKGLVRLASAVRAAEAWREAGDAHVLAAQLDVEVEAARRHDERDYDEWRAVAAKVRASASWASHDELQRRRTTYDEPSADEQQRATS